MKPRIFLTFLVLALATCQAKIIQYDGTYVPYEVPSSGQEAFSWADFGNPRSTGVDGFTMTTSEGTGSWFGYHSSHNVVSGYWTLGNAAEGNYVKLVSKLSTCGSGWSMYMYDGSYSSYFQFEDGYTGYYAPDQPGLHNVVLNSNVFHTYEFWLKGGKLAYAIDGTVYYAGDALVAPASQYLIIGDGSAYGGGGVGTMTVRQTDIYTGSDFANAPAMPDQISAPEPLSALLCLGGLSAFAAWRRNRLDRL